MKQRNYSLDFLKFISSIGIVWMHFRENTCPAGIWIGNSLVNKETTGMDFLYLVEIFFVLSGFFMYPYIERIKEGMSFKKFFIPRLIRILPMLLLCTIVLEWLYSFMVQRGNAHGLVIYPPNLFGILITGLGVEIGWGFTDAGIFRQSWYLDVLLLEYLLFYISVKAAKRMRIDERAIFAGWILLGTALVSANISLPFLQLQNGRAFVAFFVGVLLADRIRKGVSSGLVFFSAGSLIIYTIYHLLWPQYLIFGKTFLVSFFVAPALIVLFHTMPAKKVFFWKGWGELGKISFMMYLIHMVLIAAIFDIADGIGVNIDFGHGTILFMFILLVILCAGIIHYVVEEPIRKALEKKLAMNEQI